MEPSLPQFDATPFLDEFRTAQISHLLTAAVAEFDIGTVLSSGSLPFDTLRERLGLAERSAIVLLTAMRSIGVIDVDTLHQICLTPYGREKMDPSSRFHLRGYIGLGAFSADVQNMIECLKNDRPVGSVSFVYHDGEKSSALDDPATADLLTRAMADRAHNVAPDLARQIDLSTARCIADVGGGHGIYSYHLLVKHPDLRAIVIDRAPALEVARDFAEQLGLAQRVELLCADVHTMEIPDGIDAVLMANLLHDYNSEDAMSIVRRFAQSLLPQGRLFVLDSFLNAVSPEDPPIADGPRAVAAYSGLLFSICEGRCYRLDELQSWLTEAGLEVDPQVISLPVHSSVLTGHKR